MMTKQKVLVLFVNAAFCALCLWSAVVSTRLARRSTTSLAEYAITDELVEKLQQEKNKDILRAELMYQEQLKKSLRTALQTCSKVSWILLAVFISNLVLISRMSDRNTVKSAEPDP